MRGGFALLTVLLVLLALLVLCAPFLLTARNASKASTQLADRAQARLALDAAMRHARGTLGGSHVAVDRTPYFDDVEEITALPELDPNFIDRHDEQGVMWDATVVDVAGQIDLNSAPPQVIANLLGATTRLVAPMKEGDHEMSVSSTFGFPEVGYLWVGRELVGYSQIDGQSFKKLVRGVAARTDDKGNSKEAGPTPPSGHEPGTIVIDQRAFAPAMWRTLTPDASVREFDAPEQLRDAVQLALGVGNAPNADASVDDRKKFSAQAEAFVAPLLARGTTYGGIRAGHAWQRAVRLVNPVEADKTGILELDERRWFAPGATIEVTDGARTELAIVWEVVDRGIRLMEPLKNDYDAFTAEVRALARRPVNVNLASPEVLEALLANLQLYGKGERVTRDEAHDLAALIVESRPFTGLEDFLRRIVLPAAGLEKLPSDAPVKPAAFANGTAGIISTYDAVAIYTNALNANDSSLAYSTMPFSFTSRDVFDFELRAAVNAPSGVERIALVRDEVEMVVPQTDLLQVWARQEDFDDAFRLDLEAPFWCTGPNAIARWDAGASPPSKFWPHFGTFGGAPYLPGITQLPDTGSTQPPSAEHVFASREETGWAQLWATRAPDQIEGVTHRFAEHFDHETRDLEGRYLPDEPLQKATNDIEWTAQANRQLLRAFDFQLWFKPRQIGASTLVDIGRTSVDTDRVQLLIEGQDLVLRVKDGAGDQPDTAGFNEWGECRFSLAQGDGPGLLADTWSHVGVEVRGTRPSQMNMTVDGRTFGVRKLGQTRLASALPGTSTSIAVESVEGFPDPCVLRIGQELIECVRGAGNTFDARPQSTGERYGFGGRLARVPFAGIAPGLPTSLNVDTDHPQGAIVEVYGYASTLASNVPSGSARLPAALGPWTVARAIGVVGGSGQGDQIIDADILYPLGLGIDGQSQITGLQLDVCDAGVSQAQMMEAFSPGGGYAALVQMVPIKFDLTQQNAPSQSTTNWITPAGTTIFGVEIVRYSSITGTTLNLSQRAAMKAIDPQVQPHAFVVAWDPLWRETNASGPPLATLLNWQLFVVPISVPIPGGSTQTGFLASANGSEFAQITELVRAEETEWLRYDVVTADGFLVRNEATALQELSTALTLGQAEGAGNNPQPIGPGGGGHSPQSLPKVSALSAPAAPTSPVAVSSPVATPSPAASPQTGGGYLWQAFWTGNAAAPDANWPITRAASSQFQFRGVFGTYSRRHESGTLVLPVWRTQQNGLDGGQPGRFDSVVLMEDQTSALGWPERIHRTWRPLDHMIATWQRDANDPMLSSAGTVGTEVEDAYLIQRNAVCVALDTEARVPVPMTTVQPGAVPNYDSRTIARVMKHPSGERPREVDRVVVGGTIRGGEVVQATADEVVFHSTAFAENAGPAMQGGQLVLREELQQGARALTVDPNTVRIAWGRYSQAASFLTELPEDSGLLLIGDEILCYDSVNVDTGAFTIPEGGRGLLGTTDTVHEIGESALFLDQYVVGVTSGAIGAGDSTLPLTDVEGFPARGTVIAGDELIHYTRVAGSALDMPRRSSEAGKKDRRGDGLFRGRFGTTPQAHPAGTPVILYPFRYWDRWTERSDAPELSYFGLCVDQPNAYWRTAFWQGEEPSTGQVKLEVLQREVNRGQPLAPWDGEPGVTPGLTLWQQAMPKDQGNPIQRQADLIEWRAHVRFEQGAFDALTGLSHGWKQTPRLRVFGAEYMGPNLVLRRVDE